MKLDGWCTPNPCPSQGSVGHWNHARRSPKEGWWGVPHCGCYTGHPGWRGNPNILAWGFDSRLSSVLGQGIFSNESVGWSQTPDFLFLVIVLLWAVLFGMGNETPQACWAEASSVSPPAVVPVPNLPRTALGILSGTSSMCPDHAGLRQVVCWGVLSFISHSMETGRAATYCEVCGMSRQLALRLELLVGGGGREQATAAGPAGRRQVLAGVFVFRGVGEGRDGRPEQLFIFIDGYCQAAKENHSIGMSQPAQGEVNVLYMTQASYLKPAGSKTFMGNYYTRKQFYGIRTITNNKQISLIVSLLVLQDEE